MDEFIRLEINVKTDNPTDYLGTIVYHPQHREGVLTFASDDTPPEFSKVRFIFAHTVLEVGWWAVPKLVKLSTEKLTLSPFPDRLNGPNAHEGIGVCEYEARRELEARALLDAA